ncbi:general substrate transporter [Coprinopsis marcescibilis]|uniref:General substrate transporter n=1 Tax=Coprinopsis marcescibilis TaxID=230819 RepID=A0A5C3KTY1_COPMA|nr:general substrate transporter [Coprinopsis marcescibilis]
MLSFKHRKIKNRYPRWMVGKPLLFASSALASLGDAMFGYSQGVIAAAQVQPTFIKRMYGPSLSFQDIENGNIGVNPFVQAVAISCLNITAFLASFASSYTCDYLGRRMSVRIGAFIYFVAALIQIFMPNFAALIIGRCIQGVGVGILSMTVPILQCEIAPGHSRGLFVAIEYFFLNTGYALSAWVGYGFFFKEPSELSWRGPYIVQAILSVILFLWTFILPETPRWLIQSGRREEALQVLADLHGTGDVYDPMIVKSFMEIEVAINTERALGDCSWTQLFTQYKSRAMVGVSCQQFAQSNGINAILYFLPENLLRAGFVIQEALLYSGACAIIYCAGTIPTMIFIDKWGRRKFLLVGSAGLTLALACLGALQFHVDKLPEGSEAMRATAFGFFAAVCVYLFVYGATWGPTPWLLGAEIFPIRARGKGMALSTSVNWITNFLLAFITPPLFSVIHGGFYFVLLGSCATSGFIVWKMYPETAGKTLEQLGEVFGDDAGAVERKVSQGVRASMSMSMSRSHGDMLPDPRRLVDMALMPASEDTLATNASPEKKD